MKPRFFLFWFLVSLVARGESLPKWFDNNSAEPLKIFNAWTNLTIPEAVVYGCCYSNVIAGVLRDQNGKVMPFVPLAIRCQTRGFPGPIKVQTDANGLFLYYGAPTEHMKDVEAVDGWDYSPNSFRVLAAPQFPFSRLGYKFATSKHAFLKCEFQQVTNFPGQAFYLLRCNGTNSFNEGEFEAFKTDFLKKEKEEPPPKWTPSLQPKQGPTPQREKVVYRLNILSPSGFPLPKILISYRCYDQYVRNDLDLETDSNGECTVEEYLLIGKDAKYYSEIERSLWVNAPGYVVGPVDPQLVSNGTNNIVLPKGATIIGEVHLPGATDYNKVEVIYDDRNFFGLPPEAKIYSDGTFSFTGIMPDKAFKLEVLEDSSGISPRLKSKPMVLKPGEQREGVDLTIPSPAALGISLLDEKQRPVTNAWYMRLESMTGNLPHGRNTGSFLFFNALVGDYKLIVISRGFLNYTSGVVRLAPGELRLMQATLIENPGKYAIKPLRSWLEDLKISGSEEKEWAEIAVRKIGTNALPELLQMICSTNKHDAELAIAGFETLGARGESAIPRLLEILDTETTALSTHALVAVGSRSIGPFIARLNSKSLKVRQHAVWAMGEMKVEAALPHLIQSLKDEDSVVRGSAIWALGQIKKEPARVLPLIASFLTQTNKSHRSSAAYALGSFGKEAKEFAPEISKLLNDDDARVRDYAKRALEDINYEAPSAR